MNEKQKKYLKNVSSKVKKLQKEIDRAESFKHGVSYHAVVIESENEIETLTVADELGEDINAWEIHSEALRQGKKSKIIKLKDLIK